MAISLTAAQVFFSHRLVVVGIFLGCPPYIVAGVIVEYDEFILGRTAGIYTGHYVYGAEFGYNAFSKPSSVGRVSALKSSS